MADLSEISKLLAPLVSAVLAGGASGASALVALGQDLKKRITELEAKTNEARDDRKAMGERVEQVEDLLRRLRREIENWAEDPPDWAKRMLSRTRTASSMSLDHLMEVETRVDQKILTFNRTVKSYEDQVDDAFERIKQLEATIETLAKVELNHKQLLSRDEYEKDSLAKAEELNKIRENISTANSLLRGVMAALGYLNEEPTDRRPR